MKITAITAYAIKSKTRYEMVGQSKPTHQLPNFYIQEFQPKMFNGFNPWLEEPLRLENGGVVVPTGPGLGITLNQERFAQDIDSEVTLKY